MWTNVRQGGRAGRVCALGGGFVGSTGIPLRAQRRSTNYSTFVLTVMVFIIRATPSEAPRNNGFADVDGSITLVTPGPVLTQRQVVNLRIA